MEHVASLWSCGKKDVYSCS